MYFRDSRRDWLFYFRFELQVMSQVNNSIPNPTLPCILDRLSKRFREDTAPSTSSCG
jgi:hypothetical protein